MYCNQSGLAAVAQVVDNNFNVKVYTEEMMNAITNPLADLTKTQEAYQYFHSMYEGQDFVTSSGETLNFGNLPAGVIKTLHADVIKVLKSYAQVNVPIDNAGHTTPLLTSDGKKASLYDVVANPNQQFHIDFQTSAEYTGSAWHDSNGYDSSPAWSYVDGTDMQKACRDNDRTAGMEKMGWGSHLNFQFAGLQASTHEPTCSNDIDWNLSGAGTQWAKLGALNPATSNVTETNLDTNNLENYLYNNM